ncbi:MAG TPA: GTPase [Acidimicrobiia bacterium]|nr:GTPase [Acidimicrobiia bacterium]
MTSIADFRRTLASVPRVALTTDDLRVLNDSLNSLDALERIDVVPTTVAIVGSSGSGKSLIVNAVVGHDVAPVGVVRPTTTRATMYGGSGPVSLASQSEYVHVPSMRAGLLLIDTPAWEHDPEAVRAAVRAADLVVVVATPSRYADASFATLLDEIPSRRPSAVVLNRIAVDDRDRDLLVVSVRETLGAEVIQLDEGGDVIDAVGDLLDALPIDSQGYQRATVLRNAAAAGGRFIAKAIASTGPELARLERALAGVGSPDLSRAVFTVYDDWDLTRDELTADVRRAVDHLDGQLVGDHGPDLASRIRAQLAAFDAGLVEADLDAWMLRSCALFRNEARVRLWKRSANEMLDRFGWRRAINSSVEVPGRMRRVMGSRMGATAAACRSDLEAVLNGAVARRRAEWLAAIGELNAYAPGDLLALSDEFRSVSSRG